MSYSRSALPLTTYFPKIRHFFSEVPEGGACHGHALMGVQALITESLPDFTKRIEAICYGVTNESQTRIKLRDLKRQAKQLGLKREAKQKDTKVSEIKRSDAKENAKVEKDNDALLDKFYQIVKDAGLEETIPELKKWFNQINQPKLNAHPETQEISAGELAKLIRYAWRIKETLMKNRDRNISAHEQNKIIDRDYPYLQALIDLEIHLTNLAVYHMPEHPNFKPIFTEPKPKSQEYHGQTFSLFASVALDEKREQKSGPFVELAQFSHRYQVSSLQTYFATLATAIKNQLATMTEEQKKLSKTSALPFALFLQSDHHAITVGFDLKNEKWIIIDINNLPVISCEEKSIGETIVNVLFLDGFKKIAVDRRKGSIVIGYNHKLNKWFLQEYTKNIFSAKKNDPRNKLAHKFCTSLETTKHYNYNIATTVYTSPEATALMKPIIKSWRNSKSFMRTQAITSPENGTDQIFKSSLLDFASWYSSVSTIKKLIRHGANTVAHPGLALCRAVWNGRVEMVKSLILAKVNINVQFDDHTILTRAVHYEYQEIVKLLLDGGADVNFGWVKPLYYAIKNNRPEMVKLLIAAGADVNLHSHHESPLNTALKHHDDIKNSKASSEDAEQYKNSIEIMVLLIKAGASFDKRELATIVQENRLEIIELLIAHTTDKEKIKSILLSHAITEQNISLIDKLILMGANPRVAAPQFDKPLFLAIRTGNEEIVKKFIKETNLNEYSLKGNGETPLCLASNMGYLSIAQLLIKYKADINKISDPSKDYGASPLWNAACHGHNDLVRLLIRSGADVNQVRLYDKLSPLYYAIRNNYHNVAKQLITAGAHIKIPYSESNIWFFAAISNYGFATFNYHVDKASMEWREKYEIYKYYLSIRNNYSLEEKPSLFSCRKKARCETLEEDDQSASVNPRGFIAR